MSYRILSIFFFLTVSAGAQLQDLSKNFHPLKSVGPLPPEFRANVRDVVSNDIAQMKKEEKDNKYLKTEFLTLSNYEIDRILRSGNVLVNDEVSKYLNEVADGLLKDNPTLRKKLHIFALKSSVVNAYSYDKGYIFIDVGLIAQLESEAQLAYVLCHEISHYTKQHHITGYVVNDKIEREKYDRDSKVLEKCQYSREHESEADLEGFKIYERTTYDLKQAEKGFTVLQYSHLPFELEEVKRDFFETADYKLPNDYFLKEYNPIIDNGSEDDSKMTHPNTKKRKQAIAELVRERDNSKRIKETLGAKRFEYIRDLCRMELCRLYLRHRDYPNAFYAAYILQKKYPDNQYVLEMISKSLYGICLYELGDLRYTDDSYLSDGIKKAEKVESYPQEIYHLIEKMNAHEWAVLALNKVYRYHQKFPENKQIATVTDSLFSVLDRTHWTGKFIRKRYDKEKIDSTATTETGEKTKTELIEKMQEKADIVNSDTAYYYNAFVDLFLSDREFVSKFPSSHSDQLSATTYIVNGNVYQSSIDDAKERINNVARIDTLLLLEPLYIKLNLKEKEAYRYIESDEMQEELVAFIQQSAKKLGQSITTLDPGELGADDAEKMNDLSMINDWFNERFDSKLTRKEVLNIDNITEFRKRYNIRYILRTGIANVVNEAGKSRSYFFAYVFDLEKNKMVYSKYEMFPRKDNKDLFHSKIYQMLFELQHPKEEED